MPWSSKPLLKTPKAWASPANSLTRPYGLVRLFAGLAQAFGVLSKGFDDHGINAGVDETTAGTRGFGRLIAAAHSGQIQAYLGAIAIGMLLLLVLYAWLG